MDEWFSGSLGCQFSTVLNEKEILRLNWYIDLLPHYIFKKKFCEATDIPVLDFW